MGSTFSFGKSENTSTDTFQHERNWGGARPGAGRKRKLFSNENTDPNTPEKSRRLTAARDLAADHQQLANHRGHTYGLESEQLLLSAIIGLIIDDGLSHTGAINKVNKLTHAARDNLFALYKAYLEHGLQCFNYIHHDARGAAAPTHVNHAHHFDSEHVAAVHEFITDANASGKGCITSDITDHLKKKFNIIVELRTMQHVLHAMGYQYKKAKLIGKLNDEARCTRIRTFIVQYNLAVKMQLQDNTVIVYTDESYVNTGYGPSMTWINESISSEIVRPRPTGKRLVILHAITSHGLLAGTRHTAELFYEVSKKEIVAADYHDNMNGNIYLQWMRTKLIPAFKEVYPNKKMVLVLDNAKYHHVRGEGYVQPNDMKKKPLSDKLKEFGIFEFTVERRIKGTNIMEYKTFRQNTYELRGSNSAPYVPEMKLQLKNYLLLHPEHQTTEVQKLMKENGYDLIYTPPYLPNVQPIEMIWSYVKRQVSRDYVHNRTPTQLLIELRNAFYGQHGVTAELCQKDIEHCHKWINNWIADDEYFRGTIGELVSAVAAESVDVDDDIDDEMEQQDLEATGDDIDTGQNGNSK